MRNSQARTTYLKDYRPPLFTIETTDLEFDLYEDHAMVVAKLLINRNRASNEAEADTLILHGQELELRHLVVGGTTLSLIHI